MLNSDDSQFETYLKAFRPNVPEVLPIEHRRWPTHPSAMRWSLAIAVLLIVAATVLLFGPTNRVVQSPIRESISGTEAAPLPPLTLGRANLLLANAPSFKDAVDSLAIHPSGSSIPKGKQSAIAVLRKEKFRP